MARITKEQHAVLDLLDFIHFHEISNFFLIDDDLENIYTDISIIIDNKLKNKLFNLDTNILYKHYFLCALEIKLTRKKAPELSVLTELQPDNNISFYSDEFKTVLDFKADLSLAILLIYIEQKKLDKLFFMETFGEIFNEVEKNHPTIKVINNLSLRVLCTEHKMVSLNIYRYFLSANIFNRKNIKNKIINDKDNGIFLRFLLIIESENIKKLSRNFSNPQKELTIKSPCKEVNLEDRIKLKQEYIKKIDAILAIPNQSTFLTMDYKINNTSLLDFIKTTSYEIKRERFFSGNNARLISTFGAFLILLLKKQDKDNIIAIYSEASNPNKRTICEIACDEFRKSGLNLSSRTLYLRYKELKNNYEKIKFYTTIMIKRSNYNISWSDYDTSYETTLKIDPDKLKAEERNH